MSHTNLTLGSNWDKGEWPDYVFVTHGAYDGVRYVPERTCEVNHYDGETFHLSCEHEADGWVRPSFCPMCGAKVVDE